MNNHQILSNLRANHLSRLNYIICVFLDLILKLCYKYKTNMQQRMLLFACSAKLIHFPKQHLCYPVQDRIPSFFKDLCMHICMQIYMYVYGCFVCMYICLSKDSIRCNKPMFIDSCKPPFVCWKLNSAPLEKPSVL